MLGSRKGKGSPYAQPRMPSARVNAAPVRSRDPPVQMDKSHSSSVPSRSHPRSLTSLVPMDLSLSSSSRSSTSLHGNGKGVGRTESYRGQRPSERQCVQSPSACTRLGGGGNSGGGSTSFSSWCSSRRLCYQSPRQEASRGRTEESVAPRFDNNPRDPLMRSERWCPTLPSPKRMPVADRTASRTGRS